MCHRPTTFAPRTSILPSSAPSSKRISLSLRLRPAFNYSGLFMTSELFFVIRRSALLTVSNQDSYRSHRSSSRRLLVLMTISSSLVLTMPPLILKPSWRMYKTYGSVLLARTSCSRNGRTSRRKLRYASYTHHHDSGLLIPWF